MIGRLEVIDPGPDDDVGVPQPALRQFLHHEVDGAVRDRADGFRGPVLIGLAHAHRDDHIHPHRSRDIHGDVVEDAAIREKSSVEPYRIEGSGQGHRRAEG